MHEGLVLAFDTSGPYIAAALVRGGSVVASTSEDIARGQGEHLVPRLQTLMTRVDADWEDLEAVGCGIGPGNFTGIRISVSAARGLALGLGVPSFGVSTFDALHFDAPEATALVPAPRGLVHAQAPGGEPTLVDPETVLGATVERANPKRLAETIALIGALGAAHAASPLYLKPPDAAPAADPPPVILE